MVTSDCQSTEVCEAVQEPLARARQVVVGLEALYAAGVAPTSARVEQSLQDVATLLLRTAELLNQIPAQISEEEGAAFEAQAESLRRYFSHTDDIAQRFSVVMNFFKDKDGPVPLGELTPLLVKGSELRREDAIEQARCRLERFKDCSLLEARRDGRSWCYSLTEHARDFIDRGVFASMGVYPGRG